MPSVARLKKFFQAGAHPLSCSGSDHGTKCSKIIKNIIKYLEIHKSKIPVMIIHKSLIKTAKNPQSLIIWPKNPQIQNP